jgi:single-stranded DNA-binding protein
MLINEIKFAGNAGKDAETANYDGGEYVRFSLCHTKKGKDGKPDKLTWIDVVAFGYTAKDAILIRKGDNVFVSGELSIKKSDDKTYVSIVAYSVGRIQRREKTDSNAQTAAADFEIPF